MTLTEKQLRLAYVLASERLQVCERGARDSLRESNTSQLDHWREELEEAESLRSALEAELEARRR